MKQDHLGIGIKVRKRPMDPNQASADTEGNEQQLSFEQQIYLLMIDMNTTTWQYYAIIVSYRIMIYHLNYDRMLFNQTSKDK